MHGGDVCTCGPMVTWNRLSGESPPIKNRLGPLFLRKYSRALMALSTSFCLAGSSSCEGTDWECCIGDRLGTPTADACLCGWLSDVSPVILGGSEGRQWAYLMTGLDEYEGLLLVRRGTSGGSTPPLVAS